MDGRPHLRRGDSISFLGEHNMQILRKSLQHIRKQEKSETVKLRRNNSSNNNADKDKKILPKVDSLKALQSAKLPHDLQVSQNKQSVIGVNFTNMSQSITNSKMFMSNGNNNSQLSDKVTKIKAKVIETPCFFAGGNKDYNKKSPTSALHTEHLTQMEQKPKRNSFVFPFKTSSNKLIKIMSSDKLKTPKKAQRNSANSKQEERDSSNNEKKDLMKESHNTNILKEGSMLLSNKEGKPFFAIRHKRQPSGGFVSKFDEKEEFGGSGIPEGESVILDSNPIHEKEKEKEKESSLIRTKSKFSKEEHKKINMLEEQKKYNMLWSTIVEKAEKEEEHKKKGLAAGKRSPRLYEAKKIQKEILLAIPDTRILSCKFNQEDNLLAISGEDGITRIMTPDKKSILRSLADDFCSNNPANNVRWKPKDINNILLVTNINGFVTHWDVSKKKYINQVTESQNVYTADYNLEGTKFAVAGTDTTVKIYEQFSSTICYQGHANRVYALKFHNSTPDLLLSGGWDETVLFWDLRVAQKENPVNYMYGPLICGEALDVNDNYVLTGSWREKQQLEIWDMRKLQLVKSLDWIPQKKDDKSYIYSAQFSKFSQNYIIAGSSGASEIRIFHLRNEEHCGYECIEIVKDLNRSVYTMDFCHETNTFVYGDGNGDVGIVDIL